MMMHFDGIFSELGYAMPQIALQALLTVNKVNVMWNAGCYINSSFNSPPISYGQQAGRVTAKNKPWKVSEDVEWKFLGCPCLHHRRGRMTIPSSGACASSTCDLLQTAGRCAAV